MEFIKKNAEDAEELSSYLHPIWREVFDPMMGEECSEYIFETWTNPEAIRESMRHGYEFGFMYRDGVRTGLYSYRFCDDGRFYINKLYLEPQFRGKGLGQEALASMLDLAKKHGCSGAYLNVYYCNDRAIKAYLKAGFDDYYHCLEPLGNGFSRNDLVMSMHFRPEPPRQV